MDPTLKSFTPGLLTTFQDLECKQQAKDIIGTCMTCKESLTSISLEVAAALRAFIMSLGTTTFCWTTCQCQLKIVLLSDEFEINQIRIYSRHVHTFSKQTDIQNLMGIDTFESKQDSKASSPRPLVNAQKTEFFKKFSNCSKFKTCHNFQIMLKMCP